MIALWLALVWGCLASESVPEERQLNESETVVVTTALRPLVPVEFLGCIVAGVSDSRVLQLRLSNSTTYVCRFGWRAGTATTAVGVSLSGYSPAQMSFDYDKLKMKKIALNASVAGGEVKFLQLFATDNPETPSTWFTFSFNYSRCVGNMAEPLSLMVRPIGTSDWEPVEARLDQSIRDCFHPPQSHWWWNFAAQTSSAEKRTVAPLLLTTTSTSDRSAPFIVVMLVAVVFVICLTCFYTSSDALVERNGARRVVIV